MNVALAPLNETLVAPVKFVPVSVAVVPWLKCEPLRWVYLQAFMSSQGTET